MRNKKHNITIAFIDNLEGAKIIADGEAVGGVDLAAALSNLVDGMYPKNDPRNVLMAKAVEALAMISAHQQEARKAADAFMSALAECLPLLDAYESSRAAFPDMPTLAPFIDGLAGYREAMDKVAEMRTSGSAPPKAETPDPENERDENDEFFDSLLSRLRRKGGPPN
jgi:hypothetical protein